MESSIGFNGIISLLGLLGLGGILGAYFQSLFQANRTLSEEKRKLKRERYGAIIIQMMTILNPEKGLQKTQKFRPDLNSLEDFKEEVSAELMNCITFASDDVIESLNKFLHDSSYKNFVIVASKMREDIWGKRWFNKSKIKESSLDFLMKKMSE